MRQTEYIKEYNKAYQLKYRQQHPEKRKKYDGTIKGQLQRVFGSIQFRIANPVGRNACYKNVKNKFKSLDEFRCYVSDVLKVDPRGLQIHRIDSKRHYEPGNITFMVASEHTRLHHAQRKEVKIV